MMVKIFSLFIFAIVIIFIPFTSFAWGPAVHIGVSLSIAEQVSQYLKILLLSNVNEFLYGCLAPDFIVGKSLSERSKHSHQWSIGFALLDKAENDKEKAFAYGYLSHLSADAVAHGIMLNDMDYRHRHIRHTYLEMVADNLCSTSYKELAKRIMCRYNSKLDNQFKKMVDSVLFSFGLSKLIFRSAVRVSLGKRSLQRVLFNQRVIEFFSVDFEEVEGYIELSKKFSVDVLSKGRSSPVVKISAISE